MRAFVIYVNTFTEFLFVKQGIVCRETKIEWFVRDWNYSWASVVTLSSHYPHALFSSVSVTCNIHSDSARISVSRVSRAIHNFSRLLSFCRCRRHSIKQVQISCRWKICEHDTIENFASRWVISMLKKKNRRVVRLISYVLSAISFRPLFNRLIFSLIALHFICLVSHINTRKCVT